MKIAAVGLGNRTCKYLRYVAERQDVADDRCFSSLDALAESGIEVDACIIGTPDIYHHEMALKAMRSGCHVLLEKPMAQTREQICL